ncbi:hypothetical protein N825_16100 [Skermanella stibiiresistens SB22]|uniref:Uncharacterized protein n=1 Tax=Skermanella stibiiresistens SB22 TaxID=1385369 RepID=W9GVU2_9PROT|nr:hypothetical protein N825_16100 [Skermanella stibiiresistens SB22]
MILAPIADGNIERIACVDHAFSSPASFKTARR